MRAMSLSPTGDSGHRRSPGRQPFCAGNTYTCCHGAAEWATNTGHPRCRRLVDRRRLRRPQADALTEAVRQAAARRDCVTRDQFTASIAEIRTEIATQDGQVRARIREREARLIQWMIATMLAAGGLVRRLGG